MLGAGTALLSLGYSRSARASGSSHSLLPLPEAISAWNPQGSRVCHCSGLPKSLAGVAPLVPQRLTALVASSHLSPADLMFQMYLRCAFCLFPPLARKPHGDGAFVLSTVASPTSGRMLGTRELLANYLLSD